MATVEENLYGILNVDRTASSEVIKKAYKKLSLKYHPDKHQGQSAKDEASVMFTKIKRAYEILSDSDKREIYDHHGEGGLKQYEEQQSAMQGQRQQLPPMKIEAEFTIQELYTGCKKTFRYEKNIVDIVKNRMYVCDTESVTYEAEIPAGIKYGMQIRIPNEGMRHKKLDMYGDLIVIVNEPTNVKDEPWSFHDKSGLLIYTLELTLEQALLGFNICVKHLDGSNMTISSTTPVRSNQTDPDGLKVLDPERGFNKGENLLLRTHIKMPQELTEQQTTCISEAFKYKPDAITSIAESTNVNNLPNFTMPTASMGEGIQFQFGGGDGMPNVQQCAQQ